MIYLDANAFYWYFGRDKLPMTSSVPKLDVSLLKSYLDSCNNKSIPASVLMEAIVHFREHPKVIREIVSFQSNKKFRVLNNMRAYCFNEDELVAMQVMNDDAIKRYANKLLEEKIKIEVLHTTMFLSTVSLMYADYYIKQSSSLDEKYRESVLDYIGKEVFQTLNKDYQQQLTTTLQNGYADNNKSQQYLKKEYVELLNQNCVLVHMIVDTLVEYLANGDDLYEAMRDAATKARTSGLNGIDTMTVIVDALEKDSAFLKTAETEIPNILFRKGYTKHQAMYFQLMLKAWLERGQKLRKNDIFDMLCVGVLDKVHVDAELSVLIDQMAYLISFDEIMMQFICNNNVENAKLINRFLLHS